VSATRIEIAQHKLDEVKAAIIQAEHRLQAIQAKGEFYLTMQRQILASSDVMEAWQTFMISVQLINNQSISGITH